MKNKRAEVAKVAALFCVPLAVLASVPASRAYKARQATAQMMTLLTAQIRVAGDAARSRDNDLINGWIAEGADVNTRDSHGNTPLLIAARLSEPQVEILVEHGADVNAQDNFGITALMLAANNGNERQVRLLLARGARTDLRAKGDGRSRTVLSVARERLAEFSSSGQMTASARAIVQMLQAAGARE